MRCRVRAERAQDGRPGWRQEERRWLAAELHPTYLTAPLTDATGAVPGSAWVCSVVPTQALEEVLLIRLL